MKIGAWLHILAFVFVIVGALNWGLVGLFDMNLVMSLVGSMPGLEQLVYILVGVSAVWLVVTHGSDCKTCMGLMKKGKR